MTKQTLQFDADPALVAALDAAAKALGLDRQEALAQAVDGFVETVRWQLEHIEEGLRQADAGDFVDEADWRAALKPRA